MIIKLKANIKRILLMLAFFSFSCKPNTKKQTNSVYYWKSVFELSSKELSFVENNNIKSIYIKFFDVIWDNKKQEATPIAKIKWKSPLPQNTNIVPVVYLTYDVFKNIPNNEIKKLAKNVFSTVKSLIPGNKKALKFQIDYDWSATTKEKYFLFLSEYKKLCNHYSLSVTIRMHQYKYRESSGVPPVDEGMLMYYNFSSVTDYKTHNSILNNNEGEKYVVKTKYPLKIDIAAPIFSWGILFSNKKFRGLIKDITPSDLKSSFSIKTEQNRWLIIKDTTIHDIKLKKNNEIRLEYCTDKELQKAAEILKTTYNQNITDITLYHLDEKLLNQYEKPEIIYSYFTSAN